MWGADTTSDTERYSHERARMVESQLRRLEPRHTSTSGCGVVLCRAAFRNCKHCATAASSA